LGACRSIISWNKGVNTTIRPVIKADLDAVVYFKPTVCSTKPIKSSTPRIVPLTIASFEIIRSLRKKNNANKIDAIVNRMEM